MTEHDALVEAAQQARENAHAPFSNFRVGAALVAIFKAMSEGERNFDAIAVVTDADTLTPPCGACRQIIWEFCGDVPVILSNLEGKTETLQMCDLFPKPFDSSNL